MTALKAVAVITAAGLAGCALGPNYRTPPAPTATAASFQSATSDVASNEPVRGDWWKLYDAPVINDLVQEALTHNTDLRVAAANLAEARAALTGVRSQLLPSPTLNAGYDYAHNQQIPGTPNLSPRWVYTAGLDVSYEVDLFGRIRRGIGAARADLEARQAAEDAVRVTVAAETTRAYLQACSNAEQGDVARRSADLLQQAYDIAVRQRTLGAASDFEVQAQKQLLEAARAAVPTFDAQRTSSLYQLAVLTGQPPEVISQAAAQCAAIPPLATPIPVGDGVALLKRRPDVRAAERALAADTARIGVATAELFPTVTLGGTFQGYSDRIGTVLSQPNTTFALGPLVNWTIPNVVAARARLLGSRAVADGALATFDGTVLTALKEVEQALATYSGEVHRHESLSASQAAAVATLTLGQVRYRRGSLSFLDFIALERTAVETEAELAASNSALANDQVAVFKALGGGWEAAPAIESRHSG